MPVTLNTPNINRTQLQVSWRFEHGSAGFNKKLYGIVPKGIYRGLTLSTSGTNNTVTVVPDPVHQDHLAVYETADGYSVTIRDDSNSTYSLDLSDPSLLSQTLVITIFVEYQPGKLTQGNFIVYTLTEYENLASSLKKELIVLGTVINPAAGNTISASDISNDRRTIAAHNLPLVPWKPLLGNTGFERSPSSGAITGFEVERWSSSGGWEISSTDVGTGTRCIQFNASGAGTYSETVAQAIGTSVTPGQNILVRISKKVVGAAFGGSGIVRIVYGGNDGTTWSTQDRTFAITSTDANYVDIDFYFTVPAGSVTISYIAVGVDSANYGSAGVKVKVGSVEAYLEPLDINDIGTGINDRLRQFSAAALVLEDAANTAYSNRGAAFTFARNVPTNEGRVNLERKDQNYSGSNMPPAFRPGGRITDIGHRLLGSNRILPRMNAPYDSTSYTLVDEFYRTGESLGNYTQPVVRKYVKSDGSVIQTVNAYWDGANWNKDVTGVEAFAIYLFADKVIYLNKDAGTNTWSDGFGIGSDWNVVSQLSATSFALGNGVTMSAFAMAANHNITLSGTGRILHGPYSKTYPPIGFYRGSAGAHVLLANGCTYTQMDNVGGDVLQVPLVDLSPGDRILQVKVSFESAGGGPLVKIAYSGSLYNAKAPLYLSCTSAGQYTLFGYYGYQVWNVDYPMPLYPEDLTWSGGPTFMRRASVELTSSALNTKIMAIEVTYDRLVVPAPSP